MPAKVPEARALVEVTHATVTATYPTKDGLVVRLVNASSRPVEATLRPAVTPRTAKLVDPLERPVRDLAVSEGRVSVMLEPWRLATILLAW